MIRNMWYAILDAKEVKRNALTCVTRMGEKLVLWRDEEGGIGCVVDRCAHRYAALSKGSIEDGHVVCPFHGFAYDARGRCVRIPANGKNADIPERVRVHAYPATDTHGFIWIWWGDAQPRPESPPFFDDIDASFAYGTVRDLWKTHYSRGIENQLDVLHLPFVHKTTIGRGNKTLVDGPASEWVGDELHVWPHNRIDDGSAPRTPKEAPREGPARLRFRFPNVWQNRISEDVRVLIAFAPIDNENTLFYLRFYQRVVRVPLLSHAFTALGGLANIIIERQDRRVVVTQDPVRSELHGGESLVRGDLPVILYRRKRDELLRASAAAEATPAKEGEANTRPPADRKKRRRT